MLILIAQLALICASAAGLCLYIGWGPARLALAVSLRPQAALLAPLVGYAIAIYVGYLAVTGPLTLRAALPLLLLLASALNWLAWRRTGRPRPLSALREHAAPLALAAATLLVGVLPLLRYGYPTAIGQGWDTESYLPLAQHLLDYPVAGIPSAPISPLRDLVGHPPGIGVTLGFSVFQGFTMLLSGQTALATFAPLLALLRALGVLAIYAWLRGSMGLGRGAALLAAALSSAGSLMLWIGYFNFGMQMAAWPLLALGLAVGLAAVEHLAEPPRRQERQAESARQTWRTWRLGGKKLAVATLAAVVLAALPVAYYPALTLWVPIAAGLGAARVAESIWRRPGEPGEPGPLALALAALALAALTALLAAPTVVDYFQGFSFRYSLIAQHIGPDRFIALTETLGLLAFRLPNDGPQPPAALVWLAAAIAGGLAVAGLALPTLERSNAETSQRPNRLRWLGLLLAALAYLGWLRFGRPYEYAYMKGSAYAGFLAWGLAALGAQALWRRAGRRARPIVAALALAPLLVAGWAQAITVADHWGGSANFSRDLAAVDQAARIIPPGATVLVSSDASFIGPNSGLISSALYGRTIWGHFSTAYARLSYWPEGQLPQYAVLAADERAWPLELGGRELWRSGAAAIYQIDPQARALLGRSEIYSDTRVDKFSPASLDIQRRGGPYRQATPDAPLTIRVGDTLAFGPGQPGGDHTPRALRLTLATLAAQRVTIDAGASRATLDLAAGVSQVDLALPGAAAVTLTPAQPLALIRALALPAGAGGPPAATLDAGQIAWGAAAELRGPIIQLRVPLANPGHHALRVGLTVIEDTYDSPHTLARVLAAAPDSGEWQINLDLARGATESLVGGRPTPMLQAKASPSPPDGRYFAVLTLYDGEQEVAHAPVFTLAVAGGQVAGLTPIPFTVEATPVGQPAGPLPGSQRALLGGQPRPLDGRPDVLAGALLTTRAPWPGAPADAPLAPGARLSVALFWQARAPGAPPLMISVQALGPGDRKAAQWDGALGGDWRPIAGWQAGDQVRQDVPLQIDPAAPPGRYRLALVAYDPATGQPQPFGGEQMIQLGELEVQ